MDVYVCVGSSCHLKGSYDVITIFQNCIKRYRASDVVLKASFCMGHCTDGVSVKIGGKFVEGVSKDNAEEIFRRYVLEKDVSGRQEEQQ